ncbi:MAG: hypothetical protein H8D78_01940 [Chloroflexi bacterium]|nr:hypothetical protein [Chloroflexota bacterium]
MEKGAGESIRQIFEQLDAWRHLPAYRLEPRADVFFGLYMQRVVEKRVDRDLHPVMIPELPLRRGTLFGEQVKGRNASVKVDYALFTQQCDAVFLVELKTDQASRREGQDAYLLAAQSVGLAGIIDGILKIIRATSVQYRPKYLHLLARFEELGLLRVPGEMYTAGNTDILSYLTEVSITLPVSDPPMEVLYVQPQSVGANNVIDFEEFAKGLPAKDPVADVFREYLVRWREPAGAERPRRATGDDGA